MYATSVLQQVMRGGRAVLKRRPLQRPTRPAPAPPVLGTMATGGDGCENDDDAAACDDALAEEGEEDDNDGIPELEPGVDFESSDLL